MDEFPADYECEGQMSIWDYEGEDMSKSLAELNKEYEDYLEFGRMRKHLYDVVADDLTKNIESAFPDGLCMAEVNEILRITKDRFEQRILSAKRPWDDKVQW